MPQLLMAEQYESTQELLGKGATGRVEGITCRKTGRKYAMKIANLTRETLREYQLLSPHSPLRHPNLASVLDVFFEDGRIFMVMEALRENLFTFLRLRGPRGDAEVARLTGQVAAAVHHLHDRRVVHRDVKLENICFDARGQLQLIDLGLGAKFEDRKLLKKLVGTPPYLAPEVWLRKSGPKSDIWALGVVVFLLLTTHFPFGKGDLDTIRLHVLSLQPRHDDLSSAAKAFLGHFWQLAEHRPDARATRELAFLTGECTI